MSQGPDARLCLYLKACLLDAPTVAIVSGFALPLLGSPSRRARDAVDHGQGETRKLCPRERSYPQSQELWACLHPFWGPSEK